MLIIEEIIKKEVFDIWHVRGSTPTADVDDAERGRKIKKIKITKKEKIEDAKEASVCDEFDW